MNEENKEIKTEEEIVDTQTTTENETHEADTENETITEPKETEKMLSQSEVNDFVAKRVNETKNSFFKRYGVSNREELDDLIGKCQSYDEMKERFDNLNNENLSLRQELSFIKHNIEPNRIDDIKIYFKGKELELNDENLEKELETHGEWVKKNASVEPLGVEHIEKNKAESEQERIKRIFGIDY